ncbi:MAG: metalloregulator ArsR/SmtB family transcription factor [Planctomycetota bacterium]
MKRLAGHIPVSDELSLLAEPHRLRILHLLEGLELTVGELARSLQSAQSTVSRHLKQLAEGGWLTRRTAGTATFYSMVLDELTIERRKLWITVREHSPGDTVIAQDRLRADAVIADRSLDSAAFFGRVAGEWDEVRTRLFGTRFTPLSLAGLLHPDWVVADLGCGTGNVSELIAPWVERVIAVDASEAMLDSARRRLAGQNNIEFLDADLCEASIAPGTVDAALMTLVLHHVDDPARAVAEAVRTLRATRGGGALQVVEIGPHDREDFRREMGHMRLGFAPDELREMFEQAGLSRVRVTSLPPEPSAEGPALLAATGWLRTEPTDESC